MSMKLTKYTNTPGTFEALWLDDEGKPIACVAYSGDQIDLFRADVEKHGGEIDETLLAEVEAEWVPPAAPTVIADPVHTDPVEKLRAFLAANPDVASIL